MTLLFVYGTLKRGGSNHRLLGRERFIGTARTQPHFRLYQLDGYPGMVPSDDGRSIEGELWEVDDAGLAEIELLENTAEGLYERVTIPVEPIVSHSSGRPPQAPSVHDMQSAQTYLYKRAIERRRDLGTSYPL